MSMFPGDEFEADSGEVFVLGRQLTYRGCESPGGLCSQINGKCIQWHCSACDEPVSFMGHDCPKLAGHDG